MLLFLGEKSYYWEFISRHNTFQAFNSYPLVYPTALFQASNPHLFFSPYREAGPKFDHC